MKKSEELWKESREVESDFKSLKLSTNAIREYRGEKFEELWLSQFKEKLGENISYIHSMVCYRIMDNGEKIEYYPKANKIFIHGKNTWVKPGLKWLINKFLK